MKEKIIIDDTEYEVNIIENNLFDNLQEAIDEILRIRNENMDLYDVLGDLVSCITENSQKIDPVLNIFLLDLVKESKIPRIILEYDEETITIVLLEDAIAYVKSKKGGEGEISILYTNKRELIAEAILYSEISGGW